MKLWLPMSITSKQQQNDVLLIMIPWQSAFLLNLKNAPSTHHTSKIYEKDPQTLAEAIRLIEKLSAANQLTATLLLLQSVYCLVMVSVLSVDRQVILATTALMPSVMAVINLATLPRTAPTRFLHQEHHHQGKISFKTSLHPQTEGQITLLLWSQTYETLQQTSVLSPFSPLEGAPNAFLPAITVAYTALHLMDVPITFHIVIPTGNVASHSVLTISPKGATHVTPRTRTALLLQAPPCSTRFSAQEDKATPKPLKPP